jgi:D-galactarolactone cycloisomerase
MHQWEPWLEFDTTDNKFRDQLLAEPLDIQGQIKRSGGKVAIPTGPGLGVEPDRDFIAAYEVDV